MFSFYLRAITPPVRRRAPRARGRLKMRLCLLGVLLLGAGRALAEPAQGAKDPEPQVLGPGKASAPAAPAAILPLSAVKPGMTGYGLTVFSGLKPDRFQVRVIGVLHHFLPRQDI